MNSALTSLTIPKVVIMSSVESSMRLLPKDQADKIRNARALKPDVMI